MEAATLTRDWVMDARCSVKLEQGRRQGWTMEEDHFPCWVLSVFRSPFLAEGKAGSVRVTTRGLLDST